MSLCRKSVKTSLWIHFHHVLSECTELGSIISRSSRYYHHDSYLWYTDQMFYLCKEQYRHFRIKRLTLKYSVKIAICNPRAFKIRALISSCLKKIDNHHYLHYSFTFCSFVRLLIFSKFTIKKCVHKHCSVLYTNKLEGHRPNPEPKYLSLKGAMIWYNT